MAVTMKNVIFWDFFAACQLLVTANNVPSSPILVTLMMEVCVPPKRRFLQEPHGVTSQKMAFFLVHIQRVFPVQISARTPTIPTEVSLWILASSPANARRVP
jgi:hypothetical protein